MSLFNILKKKKPTEKKTKEKEDKKEAEKPSEVKIEKKPKKEELKPETLKSKKEVSELAWRVLKEPHITEKATDLTKENQYTFKVWPRANKNDIKEAVEETYKVDVVDVKVINIPAKRRRLGRIEGWRGGYKKAIVKIKEGQKIEVLPR